MYSRIFCCMYLCSYAEKPDQFWNTCNSGEYFGIYDIFAKGASFLGSAVIAGVKFAGGTINVAVAAQAIFFALGFIFLQYANRYGEKNTNSTIIKNSDFAKL